MDTFGGFLPLTACQGCEQASDATRILTALIESALADSPHFRHTNFAWVCGCLPIPDRILPMLPGRCGWCSAAARRRKDHPSTRSCTAVDGAARTGCRPGSRG